MPNLNKVMLMGNLTRDPEIKYTPKGMAITQFGMAINRVWSNEAGEKQEEVTFLDVEFFGRKAEVAAEYLKKGRPVYVEGRLKLDSWDDKQSGQKRSKLKIIGEAMEFLGGREKGEESNEEPSQRNQSRSAKPATRPQSPPPRPPVDPDLDAQEDIPFASIDDDAFKASPVLSIARAVYGWFAGCRASSLNHA